MSAAHLVVVRNPFHPAAGRELREVPAGATLESLAPKLAAQPFIVMLNGEAVLRAGWSRSVAADDIVTVVFLPRGGGDGSNPLKIVLMVALAVYAGPMANAMLGAELAGTAAIGSITFGQIAAAGISFVGNALINAVVGTPKAPSNLQAASLAAPSPTYSLQAQGNLARLDQAIPVQYGRLCAYPDFAAQPYLEFAGNEQYLYQLLCVGAGEYDIEQVRIEDTSIDSWEEVETEVIAPHGACTLFPTNVDTSGEVSGQELDGTAAATYSQTGTTLTVTETAHGRSVGQTVYLDFTSGSATDGAYSIATTPTADTFTVTAASATTSGNVTVQSFLGPFVANAAGTDANALGLDFVMGRGLYYANDAGGLDAQTIAWTVEAREIDDSGSPVGSWAVLGDETMTAGTTTPQRVSRRYSVAAARYEVRVRRTNVKQTDSRYGHEISWAGLRGYLPETRDYGDVTLIAIKARATNNLSMQASRKINVIATRKLQPWTGSAFGTLASTRSIAWALANACCDSTWGAGLPEARVDLDGLLALDATWTARGDHFDGRFDSTISFWEALTKIARAGRAYPYMQGGVVRFARDEAATVPVALYSMRNIVRGSFQVQYLTPHEQMADAVDVAYFDETAWQMRRVQAKLPDSTAAKPAKVDLFGVINRDHAFREGMFEAACNRYRRKLIRFATDMEGFIPSFGDLIAIAHDMPQWGQTAEVSAVTTGANLITYSEKFSSWTGAATITSDSAASPAGTLTADTIADTDAALYQSKLTTYYAAGLSGLPMVAVLRVKKDSTPKATRFAMLRLWSYGTGSNQYIDLAFDTSTGATNVLTVGANAVYIGSGAIDSGDFWTFWIAGKVTHASLTGYGYYIYPAVGASAGTWAYSPTVTGSIVAWGAQLELASTPGPYVPTTSVIRPNVSVLTLTEPLTWTEGAAHYLGLRQRNGSIDGPIAVLPGGSTYDVVPNVEPSATPYTGQAEERTHAVFGAGETWRQPARVLAVRPRGLDQVEIECINEDDSVHTAEDGETAPATTYSQLATLYTAPVVEDLRGWSMPGYPEKMVLSWKPAPGAEHYLVEQSSDGATWTRTGEPRTANYTGVALYGSATLLRVAAVGLTRGPWVEIAYGGLADYMWNAVDTTLMWSATSTDAMWRY